MSLLLSPRPWSLFAPPRASSFPLSPFLFVPLPLFPSLLLLPPVLPPPPVPAPSAPRRPVVHGACFGGPHVCLARACSCFCRVPLACVRVSACVRVCVCVCVCVSGRDARNDCPRCDRKVCVLVMKEGRFFVRVSRLA